MGLKKKICKVAIVGAGNMALEHIKAFSALSNVKIIGIYSRTKLRAEKLASEFRIPVVTDSLAELYQKTLAELVVITVYETSMLEVAKQAMQYSWVIFLEKPPGYNLAQVMEINNEATVTRKKVIVGLNRRFLSSSRRVVESLNDYKNEKRFINVFDQQDLKVACSFNHHEEVVKYWMYANSIHLVDYFCFLCRGEVREVKLLNNWCPDNTIILNAFVSFSSGDEGLYQCVWNAPGPWAVSVTTKSIRWEMRPLEKAFCQFAGQRQLQEMPIDEWDKTYKPGFRQQAEQAVLAAQGFSSDSPTISQAVETMKLINNIYGI